MINDFQGIAGRASLARNDREELTRNDREERTAQRWAEAPASVLLCLQAEACIIDQRR
jgi:hypothetical protein